MKIIAVLNFLIIAIVAQSQRFELSSLNGKDFKSFISNKRVLVVGEMHGTTEVPAFVLQLAGLWRETEQNLVVALEIEKNYQNNVDEFLKSGDFDQLVKIDYFKTPDGRTSVAMGELIKGLRKLGVKIVCFDTPSGSANTGFVRDSLMAVSLASHLSQGPMIILTGNLHANLNEGYWRPHFKSAIYHLKKTSNLNEQLLSINTFFGEGTIWNCMNDGCKEREVNSNSDIGKRAGMKEFVIFFKDESFGYDGYVYFDHVLASKPLVPPTK
jgi:hypothetical protein